MLRNTVKNKARKNYLRKRIYYQNKASHQAVQTNFIAISPSFFMRLTRLCTYLEALKTSSFNCNFC